MAIHFTCPWCQKTIRAADEEAGRSTSCPSCLGRLTVPEAPAASGRGEGSSFTDAWAPPSDYLEPEGGAGYRYVGPGWTAARRGLSMIYYGLGAVAACMTISMVMGIVSAVEQRPDLASGSFMVALGLGLIGGTLLCGLGLIFCCFIPPQPRVRKWAVSALAISACLIALPFIIGAMARGRDGANQPVIFMVLGFAMLTLWAAGTVSMACYVKGIGRFVRDRALERSAGGWIRFAVLGTIAWFVVSFLVRLSGQPILPALFGIAFLVALIIGAVWYLRLFRKAAGAIRSARNVPEGESGEGLA